ncbi:RHS repeat-associated core domain-containing protein, partial [Enterovibrio sp. ZSDZ42]
TTTEELPQEVLDAQAAVEAAQAAYDQSLEAFKAAKGRDKKAAHDALKVAQSNLEAAEAALYQAMVDAGLDPGGNGNGGGGSGGGSGGGGNGSINFEAKQFYYHGDHLGSSSYITDIDGEVYEHLEYFPFGETWVHEKSNTQLTPYYFTGKELDETTGLYYFGARYYDPRTSVWQSPDPILGEYIPKPNFDFENSLSLPGEGGIFNAANLGLYSYGHNNPIKKLDTDGNEATTVGARLALAGAFAAADGPVPVGDVIAAGILISILFIPNDTQVAPVQRAVPISTTDATTITDVQRRDSTTGSYTIEFASGSRYHGKGPVRRMLESGAYRATANGTVPIAFDWTPADSDREAFKDEYRRMQTDSIPFVYDEGKDNPINFNIRQSPGKAYCLADGDC